MSSPTSILSYDLASWDISSGRNKSPSRRASLATVNINSDTTTSNEESSPITLHQLVQKLPPLLHSQNAKIKRMSIEERFRFDNTIRGTDADPVNQLFGRLDLDKKEWAKYAIFDPSKNYTRNLIATDDETFTLLLLCWNAGKESPIHDHVSTRVSVVFVCLALLSSNVDVFFFSFDMFEPVTNYSSRFYYISSRHTAM
jgi:hypothetical protein